MRLKLKETLRMAVKELRLRKGTANSTALAALVVGERGGKKQIALLTPLLKDRTELGTFGTVTMSGTTEVGDVALASLVRLSGQSLAAYGFPAGDVAGYTWRTDGPRIVGFSAESQRLAAKRKWKAWAAGSKGE
jgi:hypothetical protein